MKLIDTDILIDHFHGNRSALDSIGQWLLEGEELAVSVVTLTELMGGMRLGEEEKTERLLALFSILPINEAIGRRAAIYLRQFRRSHRLELGDGLIAATAAEYSAVVITRNVKHYPMTDIKIVVPYQRG